MTDKMASKLARERATEYLLEKLLPQVVFTEPLSPTLICLLCGKVLRDPVQLSCGDRVCNSCNLNDIPTHNGKRKCPKDGEVIEKAFPDRSALTDVMNLDCFCLSNVDGCTWKGLVLDLEAHVRGCRYCVEENCPYNELQCAFSGSQGRMMQHFKDDSLKHDCLLATGLQGCINEVNENRSKLNNIKEGKANLEKEFADTRLALSALDNRLSETTALVDQQNTDTQKLTEHFKLFEDLVARGENKKAQFVTFHEKFKDLEKKVEDQIKHINDPQAESDTSKSQSTSKKPLAETVKRLGTESESHGKLMHELGIKIRIAQCSNSDGNYTWKLDNLNTRFAEARSGKVRELYTPPLYTSKFGYKYSAKVMLAGDNNSDHLAIYIVIMQGDYDEILKFPFPYPIEITLMNLVKKPHITHTLYPDPNKVHFQRPFKNMNPAIGFARFCSHEVLKDGGFVKNDTVYFNINVKSEGLNVNEPDI